MRFGKCGKRTKKAIRTRRFTQLEKLDDRLVMTGLTAVNGPMAVVSDGGDPAVAMAAGGDYVVTWESGWTNDSRPSGSSSNIEGQRRVFDDPSATSPEFLINTTISQSFQSNPAVAVDDDGSFVVAWQYDWDASYQFQRYDGDGNAIGGETVVGFGFLSPYVAVASNEFVVAWTNVGLTQMQKYDATGASVFASLIATGMGEDTDIALHPNGSFVVTWMSYEDGIFGQVYEADGQKRGSEFQLNDADPDVQELNAEVDVDDLGNFVVTWGARKSRIDPVDGFVYDTMDAKAQRFDPNGNLMGSEIVLGLSTTTDLDVDDEGNFATTWIEDDGTLNLQAFDANGVPLAAPLEVSTAATSSDVAMGGDGMVVVTWAEADTVYVQEYLLESGVSVQGTAGDDLIEVVFGASQHSVTINGGTPTIYDAPQAQAFELDGLGGNDELIVTGTPANDTASVNGDSGGVSFFSDDYGLTAIGFEVITLDGDAGADNAELFGSSDPAKKDRLLGFPQEVGGTTLSAGYTGSDPSSADYIISIQNFTRVESNGRGGAGDYATVFGTSGDDHFYRFADHEVMVGHGMVQRTEGFARVDAYGREGNDLAFFTDSGGDDFFYSFADYAVLLLGSGPSNLVRFEGFEQIQGHATQGGNDIARIRRAKSTDMLFASAVAVSMLRDAQRESLLGFDSIDAESEAGESPKLSVLNGANLVTNGTWMIV